MEIQKVGMSVNTDKKDEEAKLYHHNESTAVKSPHQTRQNKNNCQ